MRNQVFNSWKRQRAGPNISSQQQLSPQTGKGRVERQGLQGCCPGQHRTGTPKAVKGQNKPRGDPLVPGQQRTCQLPQPPKGGWPWRPSRDRGCRLSSPEVLRMPKTLMEEELLGCSLLCVRGTVSLQSCGHFGQISHTVDSTDLLWELCHRLPLKWQVLRDIQMCNLAIQAYALAPHPPETKLFEHLFHKSSHQAFAGIKGTSEGIWRSCKIAKVSPVALDHYSEDTATCRAQIPCGAQQTSTPIDTRGYGNPPLHKRVLPLVFLASLCIHSA